MTSGQLQGVLTPEDLGVRSGHSCVPVLGMCEDPPLAHRGVMVVTGPALLVALNSDVSLFQF